MATREADGTIYTHAGPEIGVASTKAFTSQLVALHLLALYLGQVRGTLGEEPIGARTSTTCCSCRSIIEQVLKTAKQIEEIAARFHNRTDFLYLGRGINYPIALEGALKLKEISYIHAEGYPGRRDEARADRAHRRAHAGRRDRASRSRLREDARQHPGSQSARRIGHRDHHGRR